MTYDRGLLNTYEPVANCSVKIGMTATALVCGKESVSLQLETKNYTNDLTLTDVLYVPDLKYSLLSVPCFDVKGLSATFLHGTCFVKWSEKEFLRGKIKNGLYVVDTKYLSLQ